MSLINKMLQDLDRRDALPGADRIPPRVVRPVPARGQADEWLWRVVAVLMIIAVGWVAWVAYQLKPQPALGTDEAFEAADDARTRGTLARAAQPSQAPVPQQASAPETSAKNVEAALPQSAPPGRPAQPASQAPAQNAAAAQPSPETFRLARAIETPISERAAKGTPPRRQPEKTGQAPGAGKQPAPVVPSRIEKRDVVASETERAEAEFHYAVDLLKRGRAAEAEESFAKALQLDASHRGARQALVALQLERGEIEVARLLLQQGLAMDPAQPDFAIALARILIGRDELPGALAALQGSAAAAADRADHHFLHGTVLQRLGRHGEAADAYRGALKVQAASPRSWIGLGISLEALERRAEAAEAFRRALAAGPADAELRAFAEQRVRALR